MCLQRFAVRFGHFFYIFSIFGYLDNLTSHIELSLYFFIQYVELKTRIIRVYIILTQLTRQCG